MGALQRCLARNGPFISLIGLLFCGSGLLFMTLCGNFDRSPKPNDFTSARREKALWPLDVKVLQKSTYLVVLVLSSPTSRSRRDTIRQTWLSNLPQTVTKYFAIGTKKLSKAQLEDLIKENSLHSDLLLLHDLEDDYSTLTLKVLKSFIWLDQNQDFKFVFKADDDTFARADLILDALSLQYQTETMLYWGYFSGDAKVKKKGHWSEPDWNICDRYLPYARGGGYILSASLVHFIALNSNVLKLFKSEDVSVGAWLAMVNAHRIHDLRFDTEFKSRGCNNNYIVQHKQSMSMMKERFENLRTTGRLCTQEVRYAKSYVYNWKVLPSMCCNRTAAAVP